MIHRRPLIAGLALLPFAPAHAQAGRRFTPEAFGARGDGRTDDSAAFAQLSEAVNAAGGGTVVLRRTTYVVGSEGLVPARVLQFTGCRGALTIEGNGARLRCRDGAFYGAVGTGRALVKMRPYDAMVHVTNCTGAVTIADLDLDGNVGRMRIEGKHGDRGWQISCGGVFLRNNSGPELVRGVHAHHQPWDGVYIDGVDVDTPGVARVLRDVRCDMNGRQGMSVTGGRGYRFERCSFTRTGRGPLVSAPGAGVDIEASRGKTVRNLAFSDCRFADNHGVGLLADTGPAERIAFTGCTFVGTTTSAIWPRKPRMTFTGCVIAGTIINPLGDPDPQIATRFADCTLTDDPTRSPTGAVFLRKNLIADIPRGGGGVTFERCRFNLVRSGVLPWSKGVRYIDCTMAQRSTAVAQTKGAYIGTNRITGPVSYGGSRIAGTLIVNGKAVPRS